MSRLSIRMDSCLGALAGLVFSLAFAAPAFASLVDCNRSAHCSNWIQSMFGAVCPDFGGPTDNGCSSTNCSPCVDEPCVTQGGNAGTGCKCTQGGVTTHAPCVTCIVKNAQGQITGIGCTPYSCFPTTRCEVGVPTGPGDAKCECH